ncbi:hypothetical protein [Nocardia sp. NPDC004604]|uniref:hypothetical protein n=1 Tax=Nocardia sp. NPDC004604 TaxID=3157013 RepID=UPI0033B7345B
MRGFVRGLGNAGRAPPSLESGHAFSGAVDEAGIYREAAALHQMADQGWRELT